MATTSLSAKTEDDLRKEIDELQRQQRQITERLRDPRGLRRGRLGGPGPRNLAANGGPRHGGGGGGGGGGGFNRPRADRNEDEDQPPAKRRLSSSIVKLEEGEIEDSKAIEDVNEEDPQTNETSSRNLQQSGFSRRDGNQRALKKEFDIPSHEHVPRVLPKNEDPSLVNRNRRMLGQLLGTLEKFRKEDKQLSGTEAFMRRSDSLQRAEQRAREDSEKLRQQEREKIAEKRRRDLTLRARVSAKTEEKKLELLFLRWSEHQNKLCNFIRTKAEPPIYYLPKKPLDEDPAIAKQRKEQAFEEWKSSRREELSEFQKQIEEQCLANIEKDLERWQNARNRKQPNNNNDSQSHSHSLLQETMDQELDSHRLEHGPKKRNLPTEQPDEDFDVDDITVGDDDIIMDDDATRAEDAVPDNNASSPNVEKADD